MNITDRNKTEKGKENGWPIPSHSEFWIAMILGIVLLSALFLISQVNFLLFHALTELFSIGIMWAISILVWNTRSIIDNRSVLFLGIAFCFIGLVDTLHILSYNGMGVFPGNDPNLPTQFWIVGRYLQSIAFFAAPLLLNRQFKPSHVVLVFAGVTTLLIAAVFGGIFPDCFLQESGLTAFKKGSEYVISLILAAAMWQFYHRQEQFEPQILQFILLSITASILSELFFTFYASVYGLSNIMGHGLKIIAMLFLYKALIRGAIKDPFNLIFRELKARERYLHTILQTTSDGFWMMDTDKIIRDVNGAYCTMSGYARDEILGMSISDLDTDEMPTETEARVQRIMKNGSELFETQHRRKDGTVFTVEISTTWIDEEGGRFVCFLRDLSDRRKAEEAVKRNENLQRKMIANIGDVIVIIDKDWITTYNSPNIERLFGWMAEDRVGANAFDNVHPEDLQSAQKSFATLMLEPGAVGTAECRYKCKDGRYKWIEFIGTNLLHDPDILGVVGNYHDITERKQAVQALLESEARFKALHNASFGGISIHDKGIILECNRGLAEMTGYSEADLIGMNSLLLIAEQSRDYVLNNILSGYEKPYEAIGLRKNGEEFPLRLEGRNIPYKGKNARVVEFRDITDLKREEAEIKNLTVQLQQAQKMEAIGTLAGGIAHDFNNILAAILGYTEMILEDSPPGSLAARDLKKVLLAGNRAKDLVNQILAFSRQTQADKIPLQLTLLITEAINLLRSSLPTTIAIEQNVDNDCGLIFADPTQIHQIIMNLCTNAFHAMEDKGGTLSIQLKKTAITDRDLRSNPDIRTGNFLQLSIEDTGTGIRPEIHEKIFDPYFTTKETGKGTGMGLAIAHGIIKSYGGFVTCESQVGEGTLFDIYIPCLEGHDFSATREEKSTPVVGTEHILLIDDEPMLAEMSQTMLERLGYAVTMHTNSQEALDSFSTQPNDFDMVITDQTMPGITGFDLAQRMLQIRPNLPIILCTGYSSIITEEKVKSSGIRGFALKPLTKHHIAALIRTLFDEKEREY